jgi:hypothetical protein
MKVKCAFELRRVARSTLEVQAACKLQERESREFSQPANPQQAVRIIE